MGLLDVLNGMQNGPRGPSNPSAQAGGGMSPMTMAILALLAWKAVKHLGGQPARRDTGAGATATATSPGRRDSGGGSWRSPQGRIWAACSRAAPPAASSAAGSATCSSSSSRTARAKPPIHGSATGPNKPIAPGDLANALGADQINALASQSGSVARRIAAGPQPVSARRDQPFDAGRTAADRKRIVGPDLTPRCHAPAALGAAVNC